MNQIAKNNETMIKSRLKKNSSWRMIWSMEETFEVLKNDQEAQQLIKASKCKRKSFRNQVLPRNRASGADYPSQPASGAQWKRKALFSCCNRCRLPLPSNTRCPYYPAPDAPQPISAFRCFEFLISFYFIFDLQLSGFKPF